jgi:hypothetical protein
MSSQYLAPSIFAGAIVVICVALVVSMTLGHAPLIILNAYAHVLQALAKGLLWAINQRTDPDHKGPTHA